MSNFSVKTLKEITSNHHLQHKSVYTLDNMKSITACVDYNIRHFVHRLCLLWNFNNTVLWKLSAVYLKNVRQSRARLRDVYNIYLQYQACIDMDTIMTHRHSCCCGKQPSYLLVTLTIPLPPIPTL